MFLAAAFMVVPNSAIRQVHGYLMSWAWLVYTVHTNVGIDYNNIDINIMERNPLGMVQ